MTTRRGASGPIARRLAVEALDLLAYWWSRPVVDDLGAWQATSRLATEAMSELGDGGASGGAPRWLPHDVGEMLDISNEHERLFVRHGPVPCPPYESYWLDCQPVRPLRTSKGTATSELKQIYRKLDLDVSSEGELPDHIAVELEALAYALSLEESDDIANELLEAHLARWLERFCDAVAHASDGRFYGRLATLTVDWVEQIRHREIIPGPPHDQPA